MANSINYRKLILELNRLRKNLLPKKWSPTGDYSEQKRDRARAYRVLAHAEIEFYIENILENLVKEKYDKWISKHTPSYVLSCLMISAKLGWQDDNGKEQGLDPVKIGLKNENDVSIDQLIGKVVTLYRNSIIKYNNGITQQNLRKLLFPIGIAVNSLDGTWLNNMDSYGQTRGEIAHRSRRGLSTLPDPKSEYEAVQNLLSGLQDLDIEVLKLRKL